MALQLDYIMDPEASEEDRIKTADMFQQLNKALENGSIIMEVDDDGQPRFHSVS